MIVLLGLALIGVGIAGVALRRDAFVCALALAVIAQGTALLMFALPPTEHRATLPAAMALAFGFAVSLAVIGTVTAARRTSGDAHDRAGW